MTRTMRAGTTVCTAFLLFMASTGKVAGQQDPLFTQYAHNKLAFNPAYAGSGDRLVLDLITRIQWVGVKGAPRTLAFNAHTPLRNKHIGLGLHASRDALGPLTNHQAMAAFSYRIHFRSTILCLGLQAGIRHMEVNTGLLNPKDPADPLLDDEMNKRVVPDADLGVYYYGSRFYAGLSARHLMQNRMLVTATTPDDATSFTRLMRNFYAMAGVVIPVGKDVELLPSFLCRYLPDLPFQADVNVGVMLKRVLTVGAAYRTGQAVALMAQVSLGKGFSAGYSYDIWFNALNAHNRGSHEIRIGYETDLFRPLRMLTPRYF